MLLLIEISHAHFRSRKLFSATCVHSCIVVLIFLTPWPCNKQTTDHNENKKKRKKRVETNVIFGCP